MLYWEYKKFLFFFIVIFCVICLLVLLTFILNKRAAKPSNKLPVECGSHVLSSGRARIEINFYLVSILFIIFEVEFIFLIPWTFYWQATFEYSSVIIFLFLIVLILGLIFEYCQRQLNF
jgi:NADH:ubiquinone oxidoreductase subunit 3 (subunit A)